MIPDSAVKAIFFSALMAVGYSPFLDSSGPLPCEKSQCEKPAHDAGQSGFGGMCWQCLSERTIVDSLGTVGAKKASGLRITCHCSINNCINNYIK